jgi:flagellar biosynthesis/type III secretory pathway protein FliH
MSAESAVAGSLVGGLIGGSVGYKAGHEAGYTKKEQEDRYVIRSLQAQLAAANQTIESLRKEIERLRTEKTSILERVKEKILR